MTIQSELFPEPAREYRRLGDGEIVYFRQWLSPALAWCYFHQLQRHTHWQQSSIKIAGKQVKIPRLNAWYGEAGASYRYSGRSFEPIIWNRPLRSLRKRLHRKLSDEKSPTRFNSALVNCYRHGSDSVAWHADDEPELNPSAIIGSVSLGATRRFLLKHRASKQSIALQLEHGSLLLMVPPLQEYWLHSVPKTKLRVGHRINVTFRDVLVRN